MEKEPEIRDILLKMLELQQKQYEEYKMNSAVYRESHARYRLAIERNRIVGIVFGCLFACLVVAVVMLATILGSK